jgi:hypothetical protein
LVVDDAIVAVGVITVVVDCATVAVDGATVAVDGATMVVDGAKVAVNVATVAVNGATVVVDGTTVVVDSATEVVDGATADDSVGHDHVPSSKMTTVEHLQIPDSTSQRRVSPQSLSVSQIPEEVTCGTHLPLLQTVSSSHSASSTHAFSHVHSIPSQIEVSKQMHSPVIRVRNHICDITYM